MSNAESLNEVLNSKSHSSISLSVKWMAMKELLCGNVERCDGVGYIRFHSSKTEEWLIRFKLVDCQDS